MATEHSSFEYRLRIISSSFLPVSGCGMVSFHVSQVKIWDNLHILSVRKKLDVQWETMVMPRKMALSRINAGWDDSPGNFLTTQARRFGNEDVRDIREYRDGDLIRYVHWNKTAQDDRLWVKEYTDDENGQVTLVILGPKGEDQVSDEAFYQVLYALLGTFSENAFTVLACWFDTKSDHFRQMDISGEVKIRQLFWELYHNTPYRGKITLSGEFAQSLRLTGDLCLYGPSGLLFKFTPEKLEEELCRI